MAIQTKLDSSGNEYTEIWTGPATAPVLGATISSSGIAATITPASPLASSTSAQAPLIIAGNADAATARTGGTARAPNVVGATTNIAGADLIVAPGLGHGNGTPGVTLLKAAAAAASGNNAQSLATVGTLGFAGLTLAAAKMLAGVPDVVAAASEGVAALATSLVSAITTDGQADENAVTLANGGTVGQLKVFVVNIVGNAGDSVKITPATMLGGTKITFGASPLGKGCIFCWTAAGWVVVGNNGGTIA